MSFFQGKVVVVTGSSNGIGRATARLFAEKGAKLTITGRNATTLKVTKNECIAAGAKEEDILEIIGDLEDESTPRKLIDGTIAKFGQIDVLINNAGMALNDSKGRTHVNVPIADYDRLMNVNLRVILVLTQLSVPYLEKTKGAIVNVSSIAGAPFTSPMFYYSVSKAGLDQLTVQLAGNLVSKGIRVNAVNPGLTESDIPCKLGMSPEAAKKNYEEMSKNLEMFPTGRLALPEDIAKLIVFLSDRSQSEYIIGQRITIDGGCLLRNALLSAERK